MSYTIKEINLHITEYCSGHCPMCYATDENMKRKHGDFETLKLIVHNAIVYGKVERFVMVGGDPCEYPHLVELLKYIKDEGKEYGIETKNMIISNTHDYKKDGKNIEIQKVADYIDGLCVTVHGNTAKIHDKFNGCKGSYEHVIDNLNKFIKIKKSKQEICIIINIMPSTINNIENIMIDTNKRLDGKVDSFAFQRIAPIGRACGTQKYFIEKEDINPFFKIVKEIKEKYGFYIEFVDSFPLCSLKREYWDLLHKGGCNWGTEYCAVFADGTISRCAMSERKLSMNMTKLNSVEKFKEFWEKDIDLNNFRNKEHIDENCRKCKLLERCGGGCVLARKNGDPYKEGEIEKGYDYLSNNESEVKI